MPTFRIEKSNNYTIMSNYHLRDKGLSLKAKGLLSFMLSLPENWDYSLNGLVQVLKEGETSIKTTLDELKENNYLDIDKEKNVKGLFEYNYNIYETPKVKLTNNPEGENPEVDNPAVENQTQINTNIINTKKNIYCPSIADDFEKIWKLYPRKTGKNDAFRHYKAWLSGKEYVGKKCKLTNRQMWIATKKYADLVEKEKREEQYIKMGSTFFNEAIMEYVEEEKEDEI